MNLNKAAWFKQALKAERWKEPGWIMTVFCVTERFSAADVTPEQMDALQSFDLLTNIDGRTLCYWDKETREFIEINNSSTIEPLIDYKARITLNPGDLVNVFEVTDTTYGTVIINLYHSVFPFGDKIPFVPKKKASGIIHERIKQIRVKDPLNPKPEEITPAEIDRYKLSVSATSVFSAICVATGSADTFTVNKNVLILKEKLLKQHRHELDNPAIIADIEKQLLDEDSKYLGEEAKNFFGPAQKLHKVGRKRQEIMVGIEAGIDGKLVLTEQALSDGINFENTPLSADTITSASQSRGLLTADAGELVKLNLRLFQNAHLEIEECGTKHYLPVSGNSSFLINRKIFVGEKMETVVVDEAMLPKLKGTIVKLRSPGFCIAAGRDFCKNCVDTNLAQRPEGIALATASDTNVLMQDSMKAMHGRVNESIDFNLADHIS